jgi:hypothetical protein
MPIPRAHRGCSADRCPSPPTPCAQTEYPCAFCFVPFARETEFVGSVTLPPNFANPRFTSSRSGWRGFIGPTFDCGNKKTPIKLGCKSRQFIRGSNAGSYEIVVLLMVGWWRMYTPLDLVNTFAQNLRCRPWNTSRETNGGFEYKPNLRDVGNHPSR